MTTSIVNSTVVGYKYGTDAVMINTTESQNRCGRQVPPETTGQSAEAAVSHLSLYLRQGSPFAGPRRQVTRDDKIRAFRSSKKRQVRSGSLTRRMEGSANASFRTALGAAGARLPGTPGRRSPSRTVRSSTPASPHVLRGVCVCVCEANVLPGAGLFFFWSSPKLLRGSYPR